MSVSNIDEGLGSRLAEFVGISREDLPAVRIVVPAGDSAPKKYKLNQEITQENLLHFHEQFSNGKLKHY